MAYYSLDFNKKEKSLAINNIPSELSSLLKHILKNAHISRDRLRTVNIKNFIPLLNKIIPDLYFGTKYNRKSFYWIVEKILTQSKCECIYKSLLVKGYDFEKIQWLPNTNIIEQKKILLWSNIFLLNQVVKPLILFFYKPIQNLKNYQIIFYEKSKYQSFERLAFNRFLQSDYIVFDRKILSNTARGRLFFLPKQLISDYRPIVKLSKMFKPKKLLIKKIYAAARSIEKQSATSLYNSWVDYTEETKNKKIYAVKIDIQDAFGSIDINLLITIICSVSSKYLNSNDKKYIINHIQSQYVHFYRHNQQPLLWQWKHGLIQGDRLSAPLCELYTTYRNKHLLLNSKNFFHKTVDDYFFCSVEKIAAYNFLKNVRSIYGLNEHKTKTNFLKPQVTQIVYCGKIFNLDTKEVKNFYDFNTKPGCSAEDQFSIRYKFKFFNINRQIPETNSKLFLRKAMEYSYNNNNFNKIMLNTVFNSEKVCLENYFEAMIMLAYKFDAAFMILRDTNENMDFALFILKRTIGKFALKTLDRLKKYKGELNKDNLTYVLLMQIAYRAFILVFKRRHKVYKSFIEKIYAPKYIDFGDCGVNVRYFLQIPLPLRNLRLSRKLI